MVLLRSLSRPLQRSAASFLSGHTGVQCNPAACLRPQHGVSSILGTRTLTATANRQGKVLMVLYDVCFFFFFFPYFIDSSLNPGGFLGGNFSVPFLFQFYFKKKLSQKR